MTPGSEPCTLWYKAASAAHGSGVSEAHFGYAGATADNINMSGSGIGYADTLQIVVFRSGVGVVVGCNVGNAGAAVDFHIVDAQSGKR